MGELSWESLPESDALQNLLNHALLAAYSPSERRAIVCHLVYLGLRTEADQPTGELESTLESWEGGAGAIWRREKMRRDCQEQMHQIEEHRDRLCENLQQDVTLESAARDWIQKHAAAWREWWEQQPDSSPAVFPHSLRCTD